jgi:membrane associated rhomboid family serine protease
MAFLQSAPPRQPIFRAPPVVLWLIAGLALAHAARVMATPAQSLAIIGKYAFVPARYSHAFMAAHGGQAGTFWDLAVPFLSYMGLHNDFTHLAVNCLWLLAFGPTVARRFGTLLFLVFFIVCGVAGAATHLAFNWGSPMPVVGASAAISGLMAAAIRMLPQAQPWAVPGEAPLAPVFSRPILVFTAVWAAINILAGLTGLGFGGGNGLIAWQAHLGGYVVGLLLCGSFDRLRPRGQGLPLEG